MERCQGEDVILRAPHEVELPALGLFLVQASDGMAVASMDRRGTAAQSGQVSRYPARAGPAPARTRIWRFFFGFSKHLRCAQVMVSKVCICFG